MKRRTIAYIIFAVILTAFTAASVFAADDWGMFRRDKQRTGVTDQTIVNGVLQPNRPRPIWIYPVPALDIAPIDNDYAAIDVPAFDAVPRGANPGQWIDSNVNVIQRAPNATNDNYLYNRVEFSANEQFEGWFAGGAPKPYARWTLDGSAFTSTANYYVQVWFPSNSQLEAPFLHSLDAHYIVEDVLYDALGAVLSRTVLGRFTIDQTSGEAWVNLGSDPFNLPLGLHKLEITLTNETQDQTSGTPPRIVIADAVRFVQDTGSVLSSPILSQSIAADPLLLSSPVHTKPLAPVANQDASRDVGVVNALHTENLGATLADDRGTLAWHFPENLDNWIAQGITSTPAVATFAAPIGEELAIVPAGDGQVYAIRTAPDPLAPAGTPRLAWQGPGYVVNDVTGSTGVWTTVNVEPGYQGVDFLRIQAGATGETANWQQVVTSAGQYAVYVWIPPSTTAFPLFTNAHYNLVITGLPNTSVDVNQRNGGQWVRLGSFALTAGATVNVTLTNDRASAVGLPAQYVAADAMKVVPSDLSAFEFSSPVLDDNNDIYVGGTNGRIYKLRVGQQDPLWVYPNPNQSPAITDPLNPGYPAPNSIGDIYASPALSVDQATLYVGAVDGYVYAIDTTTGLRKWRYPDASDATHNLGEISSTTAVGNLIYVAIGGESTGFPFDASGRVVALTDNGNNATPAWWYPSDPNVSANSKGEFLFSSPLLMTRFGDADPSLFLGSTDGFFYGFNAVTPGTALINQFDGTLSWNPTDLLNMILSSPAGTTIQPGFARNGVALPTINPLPYAFVGSDNSNLYGIDLRDGAKDWFWNMLGFVSASPVIAKERIYAADEGGYTWAFTSRPGSGNGSEVWNIEISAEPPTGGSETGATDQGNIDIDIYDMATWTTWETTAIGTSNPHLTAVSADPAPPYEWGESIPIVVWGIKSPASRVQVSLKSRGQGRQATTGSEPVTIPAAAIQQITLQRIDPATGGMVDWITYYAKYLYSLDGSNARRTQTPGQRVTVSVTETATVNAINQSIGETFAPTPLSAAAGVKTSFVPRTISINNPLGFVYNDTLEAKQVGVTAAYSTTRTTPWAGTNGNFFDFATGAFDLGPFVRPATGTAHGTVSGARELIVADRSLLGAYRKQLNKFRVDFSDFSWTGLPPFGTMLPWEMPPFMGPWNKSTDYPNILEQQGMAKMSATGIDPSKITVGLAGTAPINGAIPASWNVGRNGVLFSISIPRFQPANAPFDMSTANAGALRGSGYTGRVRFYIDTNNNGRYDSAFGLGAANFSRRGRGGNNNLTEAYREFLLQAHVLPDMRASVAEKTIDIGQVPMGFGMVRDAAGLPVSFYDILADDLAIWDPANNLWGFNDWFKPFTLYNQGNVNLLNLKVYQPWLRSDTVSDLYMIRGSDAGVTVAAGARIPNAHTVTSLDPMFLDDGAGVSPVMGLTTRTFHKPKVGEDESVLLIPDSPETLYSTNFLRTYGTDPVAGQEQKLPQLSISVPMAQPVGTYYGKFTLYNDLNNNGIYDSGESIGDPSINLTMAVSEDRLTDGVMRGTVPHIDTGSRPNTGDMSPAAYRDPTTGNVQMIWASNRFGMENTGRAVTTPNTTDPWFLYISTLPWDRTNNRWAFSNSNALPDTSWWRPTGPAGAANVANPFPPLAYLNANNANSFFPAPTVATPNLGAAGTTKIDTVKFYSPSISVDPITSRVWSFFLGQTYKTGIQTPETRSYISEITGGNFSPDNVYDTDRPTPNSNRNIDGDWTTPKYGFKGLPAHMKRIDTNDANNLFLWTFWFGGNNGKWRISYNANIDPDGNNGTPGKNNWTNRATLPMPNGLISMAEPAPYYKESAYWDNANNSPYKDILDVVYSGYSSFYKNSDIFLSRYQPNTVPDKRNGAIQMFGNSAWRLPQRGAEYFFDDAADDWYPVTNNAAGYIPFTKLNRSATSAIWSSNDIDWDPLAGFRVMIFTDTRPALITNWTWYELTSADGVRDSKTGTYLYNFAKVPALKQLFRGVIVDPASGTVKFLRSPGKYAQVAASYTPRAYRLTTDNANDDSPFVIMDTDTNPVYRVGNPAGNPFYLPGAWNANTRPSTDRLWVFWRRPGVNKPGTGIHYKTYRYGIRLASQISVDAANGKPQLTAVNPLSTANGGWALTTPVEIDWGKNYLYFCSPEEGNKVEVSYIDKNAQAVTMLATVELIEELGPSKEGSVFGNLTQLMVSEGQISAFKDRVQDPNTGDITEDRVWAFWNSTRSGNT
ncbi:MAG: golvesin C-terminal-like domain-containing protein, partial [Armatimonadota bacterium]